MDTKTTIVYFLLLAVSAFVYCENCYNATSVSLSLMESCDSYPEVTAICIVRNSSAISWNYNGLSSSCVGLCSTPNILCSNFNDVKVDCTCGDTVITSQATFNLSSDPGVIVFCEGQPGVKANVSGSVPSLEAPTLSGTYISVDISSEMFEVIISWEESDAAPPNVEYVVDVTTQPSRPYPPTNTTEMNIILNRGVEYTITVAAQLCAGSIRSLPSNSLVVFLEAQLTGSSHGLSPIVTGTPTKETPNIGIIIGSTIAGGVIIVGLAVGVVVAIILIIILNERKRKKVAEKRLVSQQPQQSQEQGSQSQDPGSSQTDGGPTIEITVQAKEIPQEIKGDFIMPEKECPGKEYYSSEKDPKYIREDVQSEGQTSIAALFVEQDHIYFSCYEYSKNVYTLNRKSRRSKKEKIFRVVGFYHIRGIGRDSSGNTYVADSKNSLIVKFNSRFTPIRKTDWNTRLFPQPYGLLVKGDYIIVCEHEANKLIILDNSLNLHCEIYHREHNYLLVNPTDITELDGTYFVTCYAAIVAIDINFEDRTFGAHKMESMKTTNGEEKFDTRQLRGICSDGECLYVTESKQRLLCLRYDAVSKTLKLVDSITRSPIVVASNGTDIYFSHTLSDKSCHITRLKRDKKDKLTCEKFP